MPEFAVLWIGVSFQLSKSVNQDLPWYASLSALLPWLFFRWPLPHRLQRRSPLVTVLQWVRVHTGGLALGLAALSLFFDVPIGKLLPVAGCGLLLLAGWTAFSLRGLRQRILGIGLRMWRQAWPGLGEILAPVVAIWLWDRLALKAGLSGTVYLCLIGAGGMTAWLARTLKTKWRSALTSLFTTFPLFLSLIGTPDGGMAELLLLAGMVTVASLAHSSLASSPGHDASETGILWLLALAGLWLSEPLLTAQSSGAGDAQWYSLVLADAIAQWNTGIFPPMVGQSEFAFNGSSFPGRFAPYFQISGVFINSLTGGTLSVYAIKHLLAALSICGGIFTAYRALAPRGSHARGIAAGCALLYAGSPAWLGAIYGMDMYMTILTLPWLPCVFSGCVRTFARLNFPSMLWVVIPLSVVWHAHSPIALWTTLAVLVSQTARLLVRRRDWLLELKWALTAIFALIALTSLPFASAFESERHTDEFRHKYVLDTLKQHWNDAWFPVSEGADRLGDQHLGWGLGLLAVAAAVFLVRCRAQAPRSLMIAAAGLLLLLLPIDGVQTKLWELLPAAIKTVTNNWPTQRIYPVLAALVIVGGGRAALRALRSHPNSAPLIAAVLAGALTWTFSEASKFQRRGRATTLDLATSERRLLPENIVITRYAYEMFSRRPDYVTDGMMNPLMKNQLLRVGSLDLLDSNSAAALRSAPVREIILRRSQNSSDIYELTPEILLRPRRQYVLEFDFGGRRLSGDLRMYGDRLDRTYRLPSGGGPNSFGSAQGSARFVTVWTGGQNVETVRWQYRPTSGEHPWVFARVRVAEIKRGQLPVAISSLLPFSGTVKSPEPAWLETPRMFLPGYSATVNGLPTELRDSPQGLVMFRVPAGESRALLRYEGTWLVRCALWLSGTAWLAVMAGAVIFILGEARKRPAANASSAHAALPSPI